MPHLGFVSQYREKFPGARFAYRILFSVPVWSLPDLVDVTVFFPQTRWKPPLSLPHRGSQGSVDAWKDSTSSLPSPDQLSSIFCRSVSDSNTRDTVEWWNSSCFPIHMWDALGFSTTAHIICWCICFCSDANSITIWQIAMNCCQWKHHTLSYFHPKRINFYPRVKKIQAYHSVSVFRFRLNLASNDFSTWLSLLCYNHGNAGKPKSVKP